MRRLSAVLFLCLVSPALADSLTTVTVPVGDIVSNLASYIGVGVAVAVAWGLSYLPMPIRAILVTAQVEQLLTKAIGYGVNVVVGATAGKTLTFDVGVQVLAEVLNYVLTHGAERVISFMGTPQQIAEKIWARLPLDETVGKPDFAAVAASVKS